MAIDAGSVFVRLGARFQDKDEFAKYDKAIESARRQKAIEAKLGGDFNPRGFAAYEKALGDAKSKAERQKAFKAELGADYNPRAFREYERATQQMQAHDRDLVRSQGRVRTAFGTVYGRGGALFAAAGGLYGLQAAGRAVIGTASDINESLTKNQVLFGKYTDGVTRFSDRSARAFGISKAAALEYTGVFGNLFNALGVSDEKSSKFSVSLTQLASDMASFNNTSIEDALEAIRSGLVGETEPLRRFGVNLQDATLRQEAMKLGLTDTTKNVLTPYQKAMAAQALIVKQTAAAHGDFHRTQGGLANQTRILKAQISDLGAGIGKDLLPYAKDAVTWLNRFIKEMKSGKGDGGKFIDVMKDIGGTVKDIVTPLAHAAGWLGKFLADHKGARTMLGTLIAIGLAIKAWRFASAITGVKAIGQAFGGLKGDAARAGEAAGTSFSSRFKSRAGAVLKGVGITSLLSGVAGFATSGERRTGDKLQDAASSATFGLVPTADEGRLKNTSELLHKVRGELSQLAGGRNISGIQQLQKTLAAFGRTKLFDQGQLRSAQRQLQQLQAEIRKIDFGYLRNNAAGNLKDLNRQVSINMQGIRAQMEVNPEAGRKSLEQNFKLAMRNAVRLLNDGKHDSGDALKEIRRLMRVHSKGGADALAANTSTAIGTLKSLMKAGVVSTRDGTREIRRLEAKALEGFGFDAKSALNITRGNSYTGGREEGTSGAGHAAGGWIGMPGEAGGDNVPIVVGRGEAVLNRHQQGPVEIALRSVFGIGLDGLFSGIQRPHFMARGGRVLSRLRGFAKGGFGAMVGQANAIDSQRFPYVWGGGHNDAFSGPYDCSGAVSSVLHAGGILRHPLVSGQLASFGKPGPGKVTIFANPTHTYMRIGGRYFGTSNANPGGGAGWFDGSPRPGFAVRHVDAAGGTIRAPRIAGPDSPLKTLAQTALKRTASGANQRVDQLLASVGQTGGGDFGNLADGGAGSFGLGALARLWTQAGGRSNYAGLMAHVAMAESGGNPKAKNPSGATGLWQILGAVLPGNLTNPLVNARNAVSKFRSAGAHPLAPWYSSIGGWRQYVGGLRYGRGGLVSKLRGFAGGGFVGKRRYGSSGGGGSGGGGPTATGGFLQNPGAVPTRTLLNVAGDYNSDYSAAISKAGSLGDDYIRWDRRFNLTTEELIDPDTGAVNKAAVEQRAGELRRLLGIRERILEKLKAARATARRIVKTYRILAKRLRGAAAHAGKSKAGQNRAKKWGRQADTYAGRAKTWQGKLGELRDTIFDADTDVRESRGELASVLGTAAEARVVGTDSGSDSGLGDSGTTAPTPAEIVAGVREQMAAYEEQQRALFSGFGSNFLPGVPSGVPAGAFRYFGAGGAAMASDLGTLPGGGSGKVVYVADGGSFVTLNHDTPPDDVHQQAHQSRFAFESSF